MFNNTIDNKGGSFPAFFILIIKQIDTSSRNDMIKKYNDINSDEGIFSVVLVVEKPETCQAETCCHNVDKHKN